MQKILFVRKFKKISGGQIKVRDYFRHCLEHPDFAPFLYFTPDSKWRQSDFWAIVPQCRIVNEINYEDYDLVFLAGRDWEYIPAVPAHVPVINYIQHVKHANKTDKRYKHLTRPAQRICVSREVADAIAADTYGEISVIKNGISLERFNPTADKVENSIFILGCKNPRLGARLYEVLKKQSMNVRLQVDIIPQCELARSLNETDIFVALPHETEGFYLPALEAMASGCAVVCSDAVGNRGFCVSNRTCLSPKFNDLDEHLRMISLYLMERSCKERIRNQGIAMAQSFSLASEREVFYKFLAKFRGMQGALA